MQGFGGVTIGRSRHIGKDNIKMILQGWNGGGINWTDLAEERDSWRAIVNAVMNLRVE